VQNLTTDHSQGTKQTRYITETFIITILYSKIS
jgi:hypothetical protein